MNAAINTTISAVAMAAVQFDRVDWPSEGVEADAQTGGSSSRLRAAVNLSPTLA